MFLGNIMIDDTCVIQKTCELLIYLLLVAWNDFQLFLEKTTCYLGYLRAWNITCCMCCHGLWIKALATLELYD